MAETAPLNDGGLPDHFIKIPILCCAFRCDYFDSPECFGCKAKDQICCIEGESYNCKYVPPDSDNSGKDLCCVCFAGDTSLFQCKPQCRCFRQIFCFEWVCGCPYDQPVLTDGDMMKFANNKDGFDFMDSTLVTNACCCEMSGLYCQFPGCCYSQAVKGICLNTQCSFVRCKAMCGDNTRSNPDLCCILDRGSCFCHRKLLGLINIMSQGNCCASVCTLPCNDDVPCAWTLFPCCVACVDWQCVGCQCCITIGQVKGLRDKGRGIVPPPPASASAPAHAPPGQVVVVMMPAPQPAQVVYASAEPVVVEPMVVNPVAPAEQVTLDYDKTDREAH